MYLFCHCSFSHWCPCVFQVRRRKKNPHRIPLRSKALLSAGCSGTMTSILLDISGDITIFLKKDISGGDGFRPVFLSRSNKVSLIFGYCGMEVARLEMSWRIAIFYHRYFHNGLLALGYFLDHWLCVLLEDPEQVYHLLAASLSENVPAAYFI